jgi:hypothetical protein
MYPSRYHDSVVNENNIVIDKPDNIAHIRDKIMDMLGDDDYEGLTKIIGENVISSTMNELLKYAIDKDDDEMFTILMDKCKNNDFTINSNRIHEIIDSDNLKLFRIMMDTIIFNDDNVFNIFDAISHKKNIGIDCLIMMIESGYKIPDRFIRLSISINNINIIKHLISIGHDIQKSIDCETRNILHANIETLKLLTENNISLIKSLSSILKSAIRDDDLKVIVYLLQCYPDYDINKLLPSCIQHNKIGILKYLLQNGGDIDTVINIPLFSNVTIDTLKFLVSIGYDILKLKKALKEIFNVYFIKDLDLYSIKYLLEVGISIKTLFKNENKKLLKWRLEQKIAGNILSPIEYVISINKIGHIGFLFDNYYDTFKSYINRFFIIACANGQCDIAKYLYSLGVELCEKSLLSGCFFGHFEIVKMLLGWGIDFSGLSMNPFLMCMAGRNIDNAPSKPYENLIAGNHIFVNHVYNYGNAYNDILKLLISYKVQTPNDLYVIHLLKSDVEIVKYFLDDDLDINLTFGIDNITLSLLEGALLCKNFKVVELLLEHGIELHRINDNLIRTCNTSEYYEVKKLLVDCGYEFDL